MKYLVVADYTFWLIVQLLFPSRAVHAILTGNMVGELLKYARKPESPLQILQGWLEIEIQLVVHTLHAYKAHYLRLPDGKLVRMSKLGYEARLCNMALVSAAAAWDGFMGNIVRSVRASGHSFSERQLRQRLKQTKCCDRIVEPLARRHCIVHNLGRVDKDYKRVVSSSSLSIGDPLHTDLYYLRGASFSFFETAVDLIKLLVGDGLLGEDHHKTIGEFQHDPRLEYESKIKLEVVKMDENKKQFLEAMKVPENTFDELPSDAWFLSRGFPPEKVRLDEMLYRRQIWAGRLSPLSSSSTACLLNSWLKLLCFLMARSFLSPIIGYSDPAKPS